MINANIRGRGLSPTLAINERSAQLAREGRNVYRMGLGQSPFPVPPSVVRELQRNAGQKDYLPVRGLPALREAVAGYHARRNGLEFGPDDVLVGPGSKQLLFLLRMVLDATLLLPSPSWVSYQPQAEVLGKPFKWLRTKAEDEWRLQPSRLKKLAKKNPGERFMLLLNYPCNPTGHTYLREHLQGLADIARRYDVIIISDEIYGELDHANDHVSMAELYPEGTILTAGLSKWCGAGGWRLGTASFPKKRHDLFEAVAVAGSESFSAVSAPVQYAAVHAYSGSPEIETYLDGSRRICQAVTRFCSQRLREAGAAVVEPKGAFYLFPDFRALSDSLMARGITSSVALCEQLLEDTGVAALAGSAFGRREGELTLRLAPVNFDGDLALKAADASPNMGPRGTTSGSSSESGPALGEDFVRKHCPRVAEAIDKMCDWL